STRGTRRYPDQPRGAARVCQFARSRAPDSDQRYGALASLGLPVGAVGGTPVDRSGREIRSGYRRRNDGSQSAQEVPGEVGAAGPQAGLPEPGDIILPESDYATDPA